MLNDDFAKKEKDMKEEVKRRKFENLEWEATILLADIKKFETASDTGPIAKMLRSPFAKEKEESAFAELLPPTVSSTYGI
jgi:hypothetical protein